MVYCTYIKQNRGPVKSRAYKRLWEINLITEQPRGLKAPFIYKLLLVKML